MSPARSARLALVVLAACGRNEVGAPSPDAAPSPSLALVDTRPPAMVMLRRAQCATLTPLSVHDGCGPQRIRVTGGGSSYTLYAAPAAGGIVCAVATIGALEGEQLGPMVTGSGLSGPSSVREQKVLDGQEPWQLYAFMLHDGDWDRAMVVASDGIAKAKGKERDALCEAAGALEPPDASSVQPRADALLEKYMLDGRLPQVVTEAGLSDIVEVRIAEIGQLCGFITGGGVE